MESKHIIVTGGGWKGDVKVAELSPKKIYAKGWKNRYSSDEAVELAVQETLIQWDVRLSG
jgi:hypothetical protein